MKVMFGPNITYVDQEGNRGITCMALIETSHIVLHIWDEIDPGLFQLEYIAVKDFPLSKVINLLNDSFDVEKLEYKFLDRKSNLIYRGKKLIFYLQIISYFSNHKIK